MDDSRSDSGSSNPTLVDHGLKGDHHQGDDDFDGEVARRAELSDQRQSSFMTAPTDDTGPGKTSGGKPGIGALPSGGSHRKVNGTTGGDQGEEVVDDEIDEQPTVPAEGTLAAGLAAEPPPWTQAKTGRRLTFADESGEVLAEINYSNRTHYSKQPAPGGAAGTPRGCCVIQ